MGEEFIPVQATIGVDFTYVENQVKDEEDPSKYQKGINYVTIDLLDYYADLATKIILDKIYFYEKFHPELLIKEGLFQNDGIKQSIRLERLNNIAISQMKILNNNDTIYLEKGE